MQFQYLSSIIPPTSFGRNRTCSLPVGLSIKGFLQFISPVLLCQAANQEVETVNESRKLSAAVDYNTSKSLNHCLPVLAMNWGSTLQKLTASLEVEPQLPTEHHFKCLISRGSSREMRPVNVTFFK